MSSGDHSGHVIRVQAQAVNAAVGKMITITTNGQPVGSDIQQKDGMQQPVYYWHPVVSPGGMTFCRGNRIPERQNNLFIGALSGMHIVRLVIANNRVTGEER